MKHILGEAAAIEMKHKFSAYQEFTKVLPKPIQDDEEIISYHSSEDE